MKKILSTSLAILTLIALPVFLAFADDNEPSGSREDTQFAYRATGIMLAGAVAGGGVGQQGNLADTDAMADGISLAGCRIGGQYYSEIPATSECCARFKDALYPSCQGLSACVLNNGLVEFFSCNPVCGNGLIEAPETCEASVVSGTQGSCNAGYECNNCQCEIERLVAEPVGGGRVFPAARCGDRLLSAGEECDPTAAIPLSGPPSRCGPGLVCSGDCRCVAPDTTCPSAFGGYPMPEADRVCCSTGCKAWQACRDRKCPVDGDPVAPFTAEDCAGYNSAIADAAARGDDPKCTAPPHPPVCIPNGIPEGTEQCDTFGLELHAAMDQLQARCPAPAAGQQLYVCDMRDCSCSYIQTSCAGRTMDGTTVQCNGDTDCASDSVCDSNCQCHAIPPPPPLPPLPPVARQRDCSVEVMSFSSNSAKEKLDKLNKVDIAEITGRNDLDVYAEREQKVRVVCVTKALAAPRAEVVSEGVMSSWDNIAGLGSMQLTQTGGSVFINFKNPDQMKFKRVEIVDKPVRILPVEGHTGISLSDSVPIGTLIPNITSSASTTGDNANVNNMIDYRGFNIGASQTFSINASGNIDIQTSEGAVPGSTADRVDVFDLTIPAGCATWTGVEGYAGCKPYEERTYDVEAVKDFIKGQVVPGEYVRSSVVYDAPWEKIDNFTFTLDRGAIMTGISEQRVGTTGAGTAFGGTQGIATEHKFAVLAADPAMFGEGSGGCKGCYVNGAVPSAGEVLPALFAFIASLGGIVVRRMRRK